MKGLRLPSILLLLVISISLNPPVIAQQNTYPISGSVAIDSGGGSTDTATAGPFSYSVETSDTQPFLGLCTIGKACTLDTRIRPWNIADLPVRVSMRSTLDGLFTPWVQSDIQITLPTFLTPDVPADQALHEVSFPATVTGTVRGLYQDQISSTRWDVWTVKLEASGVAQVWFYNLGGTELNALAFSISYNGSATVAVNVPWLEASGPVPSGIAYDGRALLVSDVSVPGHATINRLDPANGELLQSFPAPSSGGFDGRGNPSDLAYSGGHLFISDGSPEGEGTLYEIAPDGSKVFNTMPLPFRGGAIATDGTRLFIGDHDYSQALVISRFGQTILPLGGGLRPAGMVFDRGNNLLWVIDQEKTGLIFQMTAKGRVLRSCQGPWSIGDTGQGGITLLSNKLAIAEISGFQRDTIGKPGTISLARGQALQCTPASPLKVRFDIKPDSFPNLVNPNSNGVIVAAILGTAQFDAATVNPATLRFGQTGFETSPVRWNLHDVNGDGHPDLLMHFRTKQAELTCGVTLASVSGQTFAGKEVRGTDSIQLVGCNRSSTQ